MVETYYTNVTELVNEKSFEVILTEDFERAVLECMVNLETKRNNNMFICTNSVFFKKQIANYLAYKMSENSVLESYNLIKLENSLDFNDADIEQVLKECIPRDSSKIVFYIENFDIRIQSEELFLFFKLIKQIKIELQLEEVRIIGTISQNSPLQTYVDNFEEKEFQYSAVILREPCVIEYNKLLNKVIDRYAGVINFSAKKREKFLYMFYSLRPFERQSINDYLTCIDYMVALCKIQGEDTIKMKHIKRVFSLDYNLEYNCNKKYLKNTTIHETGHLVVGMIAFKESFDARFVTNYQDLYCSDGKTLGIIKELDSNENLKILKKDLAYTLGGMAAYKVMGIPLDNGCDEDLKDATEVTRRWLMNVGANKKVGMQHYEEEQKISNQKLRDIEKETEKIMAESYDYAVRIIKKNMKFFEAIRKKLYKERILTKEQIESIYKKIYK